MKILALFAVVALAVVNIPGCGKKAITGAERDAVLAYAHPISDGILAGYNEGDFARYSKDFDAAMKNAMPESVFKQSRAVIASKIGKYVSREIAEVFQKDQYVVVLYKAKFEQEDAVEVKVVFQKVGDKNLVSGLWFNSPKLRR